MEDVYDNLENFTEESTKTELLQENKILKIKLEEYAAALDNLQKEFDMLSTEHKKLEMNYSSLLKTARSEIERKTQIITKLNIEKDAMVLNSIQNRNILRNRKQVPIDKLKNNLDDPRFGNSNENLFSSDNSAKPSIPKQVPNERKADNKCISSDLTSPRIETRFSDTVNNALSNPNLNNARNNEIKENIGIKGDEERCRARITSRRKSMPVFSMDCKFSTDEDEVASNGSSKEHLRKEQPESRNLDRVPIEKPTMEGKMSGHQEYSKDNRSRYSKNYSDKYRSRSIHQRYRRNHSQDRSRKRSLDRRRGSPERRRGSSDRNKIETHDHSEEFYKRQEYDRRSRLASPPKDKYYHDYKHRSRDSHRSNERSHLQDFERYKPRSQNMKHKMLHDYEEPSGKRIRLDSHPKHDEERWRNDRQLPLDLDHLHNMSCQSPDQTYFDALPAHQATEIKLHAATKLDDPRLSSKKYALKTQDGKAELSTVESANIDVKFVDKSHWEMFKTIKMPDALLKKPITSDMPSVALLQKPLNTGMPSALLHKPSSSDVSDAQLQKPKSPDMPHTSNLVHTPGSTSISNAFIQNTVHTDMPDTLSQKPMATHIPDSIMQNSISSDNTIPNPPIKIPKSSNMPDILTQEPLYTDEIMTDAIIQKTSNDDLVNEIYKDIENISNKSMEQSEIYNFQNDFHNPEDDMNGKKNNEIVVEKIVEALKTENGSHKLSGYKIPKKSMQAREDTHNFKITKDMHSSDTHTKNQTLTAKVKNNNADSNFHRNKTTEETCKKQSEVCKMPQRRSSELQYDSKNYNTAKDTIEGDLELSDENSDHTDIPIKHTSISDEQKHSEANDLGTKKKHKLTSHDQRNIDFGEASGKVEKHNLDEKIFETVNIESVVPDTRKTKHRKKSLKLKETKDPYENKNTAVSVVKPIEKKDDITKKLSENKDISLSMDQLVKIKENITKELLGDINTTLSVDKVVKKKENKSKVMSKTKDAALSIEKAIKKKEKQPKELSENKDNVSSMAKPVKKKEDKPKELSEKKETSAIDTSVKKKENKTKESLEQKNLLMDIQSKKKQSKQKESSENTEYAITSKDTQVKKKDKDLKIKETKFSELFGDSSSLVSPEDLGLIPTVVAPPENYVAIFEDAQDAIDMETIRAAVSSASNEHTNNTIGKADTQSTVQTPTITVEPTYQNIQDHVLRESVPTESTINQTMYQNLQPELSPKDINVLKTVIISTGTQPQCTLEHDRSDADLHVMQCVKPTVLQDTAIQALATSTPHKIWQQNVVQEIDPRVSISRCSNESREASINETTALPISDTTTNASQDNADVPDMTIFVKRRRKVLRKK